MFPALCDSCGNVFSANIIGGFGSATIIMKGNQTNCPNCGKMARILDGTYELVNNFIKILSSPQRSYEELKSFSEILQEAKKNDISIDEIVAETNTRTPGLSSLVDLLPKNREEKRSDLQFLFGILLTIILFILPHMLDDKTDANQTVNTEQVINTTINNYYGDSKKQINPGENVRRNVNPPVVKEKIGRNEKCPCGSGMKYKKCHGKRGGD